MFIMLETIGEMSILQYFVFYNFVDENRNRVQSAPWCDVGMIHSSQIHRHINPNRVLLMKMVKYARCCDGQVCERKCETRGTEVWWSPPRFINENLQIQVGGTTVWITNEQSSFSTYNFLVVEHSSYFVAYLFMLCVTVHLVSLCGKHSLAQATFRSYWNNFFDECHSLYDK